jgi:hypothetical protein
MRAATSGKPVCQDCREFRPHFHPERLDGIGKGRGNLFVGSMTDLWGDGVQPAWRQEIWEQVWWGWLVRVHNDEWRADVSPTGAGTARQTRRVTDETGYLRVRTL